MNMKLLFMGEKGQCLQSVRRCVYCALSRRVDCSLSSWMFKAALLYMLVCFVCTCLCVCVHAIHKCGKAQHRGINEELMDGTSCLLLLSEHGGLSLMQCVFIRGRLQA